MKRTIFLTLLVGLAVACGDDADNNGANNTGNNANNTGNNANNTGNNANNTGNNANNTGNNANNTGNNDQLTCSSLALCTTHEVRHFPVQPEPATGGTLLDGVYTLSWVEEDPIGFDEGDTGDLGVLLIQGNQYVWDRGFPSHVGTFSTSGTSISFAGRATCSQGNPNGSSETNFTLEYSVSGDELRLFDQISNGTDEWLRGLVFVRDGGSSACDTFSEPSEPGPSQHCDVANCLCVARTGGAISFDECDY